MKFNWWETGTKNFIS